MKALRALAPVAAAVAVGAIVGAVLVLRGGDEGAESELVLSGLAVRAEASVSPRSHLFGDPVVATVDLFLDRRRVEVDSVRLDTSFAPYEAAGSPTRQRSTAGDLVRIRYRWVLTCLARACAPGGSAREFDFRLARVDYRLTRRGGLAADTFEWPTIEVASRLSPFDVDEAAWRAEVRRLPEVSYRLEPAVLGASLLGGALVLLLAAGALAVRLAPRRLRGEAEEAEDAPRISDLERALGLLAATSANGSVPERRRALERVARELASAGLPELGARARRLAWSQDPPSSTSADSFAEEVRRANGGQV